MDEETMVALDDLEGYEFDEDEQYLGDAGSMTCSQQCGCTS